MTINSKKAFVATYQAASTTTVTGAAVENFSSTKAENVTGAITEIFGAARTTTVAGNESLAVTGTYGVTVTAATTEVYTGDRSVTNSGTTTTVLTGAEGITNSAASARTVVGQYSVDSALASAAAIRINASATAGGIDIDAGTAGIAIDTTGPLVLNSVGNTNLTTNADGANLTIKCGSVNAAGSAQVLLIESQGTAANAIDINATKGGLDVDVELAIVIDAGQDVNIDAGTDKDIKLGFDKDNDVYISNNASGSGTCYVQNLNVAGVLQTTGNSTNNGDLTVAGNLTVQGVTTTLNTSTITAEDKNIELNRGFTPEGVALTMSNTTAEGGGITLRADAGITGPGDDNNKYMIWNAAPTNTTNAAWKFTEDVDIAVGKFFTIGKYRALTRESMYVDTGDATVGNDFLDNKPAIYLNQQNPYTPAINNWRIKVDGTGDVVFQKRATAVANSWQNKFRIQ